MKGSITGTSKGAVYVVFISQPSHGTLNDKIIEIIVRLYSFSVLLLFYGNIFF